MNELSQRIALAKIRGLEGPWKHYRNMEDRAPNEMFSSSCGKALPQLNLDELHEVEKILLSKDEMTGYRLDGFMIGVTKAYEPDGFCNHLRLWHATKEERSKAILKTAGLWEDE